MTDQTLGYFVAKAGGRTSAPWTEFVSRVDGAIDGHERYVMDLLVAGLLVGWLGPQYRVERNCPEVNVPYAQYGMI
jgi:hypothetical protein